MGLYLAVARGSEEAPAAPALTAADLDRERTESIADNEARIAAERRQDAPYR